MAKRSDKRYKAISLFTGAGGLDIGLEETGEFEVIACVEKVPVFCETIRANRDAGRTVFRDLKVYQEDLASFEPERLMQELGIRPGEIDLLVGGPPCQSFSTTGKRGTVQDPRGTLLWRFLHFVEVLQPKVFLMENVRGLMSAALRHRPIKDRPEKGGAPYEPDEEPGSVIKSFLHDLNDEYRIDCFLVNAVNYGAPQLRERALFFGNRFGRKFDFPLPTHGASTGTDLFSSLSLFTTLGQALDSLNEDEGTMELMDFSPRKKKFLSMIPSGGNWRTLPPEVAQESMGSAYFAKGGRSGWWRRLSMDLPAPTIVTMPNHASTSLCHPNEVRALSVRECARVQEFPDEWEFKGRIADKYAQIGNAVPVRLGKVSGCVLSDVLKSIYKTPNWRPDDVLPPYHQIYLNSHVRTRQWYRNGKSVVWEDGDDNSHAKYFGAGKKTSLPH